MKKRKVKTKVKAKKRKTKLTAHQRNDIALNDMAISLAGLALI